MRIICDTSVWYWIGEGDFDPGPYKEKGHQFIATALNIRELSSSEKFIRNPNKFKLALNAMLDNADDFILFDPVDYMLLNYFSEDHTADANTYKIMKRKIELCRNFDPAKINTSLDEFRSKIEEFDHWYIGFANMLNESLEDVREGLMKKYGSKRKIRTRNTEKNIASMVFGFLETKYNGTSEILKALNSLVILIYSVMDFIITTKTSSISIIGDRKQTTFTICSILVM